VKYCRISYVYRLLYTGSFRLRASFTIIVFNTFNTLLIANCWDHLKVKALIPSRRKCNDFYIRRILSQLYHQKFVHLITIHHGKKYLLVFREKELINWYKHHTYIIHLWYSLLIIFHSSIHVAYFKSSIPQNFVYYYAMQHFYIIVIYFTLYYIYFIFILNNLPLGTTYDLKIIISTLWY